MVSSEVVLHTPRLFRAMKAPAHTGVNAERRRRAQAAGKLCKMDAAVMFAF